MQLLFLPLIPTSTAIFKTLIALKTRNAIIISPHPRAKNCTIAAAKVVLDAAVKAGAPEGIIGWIDVPSLELTNEVEEYIGQIEDSRIRRMITYRFLDDLTWVQVAYRMGGKHTADSCRVAIDRFLEKN